MGPERVSEPHIDVNPASISPQAGPFLAVGPVADVDIAQPMPFSSQAGPLCASELEADVGVQPIPRLKVTSMPADNKTMTPAPGGSSHSLHLLESCNSGSTLELLELWVLDGTLASAYVLRPCCCSCFVFRRCWRQIEKERRRGVILVNIQAKVYSGVSTSLYTEVKAD